MVSSFGLKSLYFTEGQHKIQKNLINLFVCVRHSPIQVSHKEYSKKALVSVPTKDNTKCSDEGRQVACPGHKKSVNIILVYTKPGEKNSRRFFDLSETYIGDILRLPLPFFPPVTPALPCLGHQVPTFRSIGN